MANLKDIRTRIKTVKSTEKITLAMKMVAAAKVKRAETKLKANKPYAKTLQGLFAKLYARFAQQADSLNNTEIAQLLKPRAVKKVGVLVIGADRGLCGSYTANILKQALKLEAAYREQNIEPQFYLVGNKLIRSFGIFSQAKIIGQLGNMTAAPSKYDAELAINSLLEAYKAGEIDAIQILYTQFVSMLTYKVSLQFLLPLSEELAGTLSQKLEIPIITQTGHQSTEEQAAVSAELLIEPSPEVVLEQLIPLYLQNQAYAAMLESSASELAARMTAMSNASKNATELIGHLTLEYNKARQAAITQEILEIVSGASALK